MSMEITLVGVGEAFDPREPNSSVLVQAEGFTLLIDCGFSAVSSFWQACPDPEQVDAVYLTHHHPDHVLGLIPMLDVWSVNGRRKPVTIVTTPWGIGHLHALFEAGMVAVDGRGDYPILFQVAAETPELGPFGLAVAPTRHAVPTYAVRLEQGGRRFAYSGDGRPTAESRALFRDADLLLHECYLPDPAPDMPYHCDLPTVAGIEGPGWVGLYHIQAGLRDATRAAVTGDPRLFVPDAGDVLTV